MEREMEEHNEGKEICQSSLSVRGTSLKLAM